MAEMGGPRSSEPSGVVLCGGSIRLYRDLPATLMLKGMRSNTHPAVQSSRKAYGLRFLNLGVHGVENSLWVEVLNAAGERHDDFDPVPVNEFSDIAEGVLDASGDQLHLEIRVVSAEEIHVTNRGKTVTLSQPIHSIWNRPRCHLHVGSLVAGAFDSRKSKMFNAGCRRMASNRLRR